MIVSAASATLMITSVRILSGTHGLSPETAAFLRTSLGLWVAAPLLASGRLARFRFSPWRVHALRGLAIGVALWLAFIGVARLPLALATLLLFMAPVFAAALSGLLLGEHMERARWFAVIGGLIGAAIVLRPGVAPVDFGALATLAAAAAFSIGLLLTKRLSQGAEASEILVSTTAAAALVTAPLALWSWTPPQSVAAWGWVAALVLSSSLRMYADIRSYAVGDAGFVAPFAYLRLVFAVAVGWVAFGESLDGWTALGAAIIVGSALYMAARRPRGGATGGF